MHDAVNVRFGKSKGGSELLPTGWIQITYPPTLIRGISLHCDIPAAISGFDKHGREEILYVCRRCHRTFSASGDWLSGDE